MKALDGFSGSSGLGHVGFGVGGLVFGIRKGLRFRRPLARPKYLSMKSLKGTFMGQLHTLNPKP